MIHVQYVRGAQILSMGRLGLKNRSLFFEYTPAFLATGLELSPLKLPLKPGLILCEDHSFDGLFGVFNDSLPDGWGRLLLDRKLMAMGIHPNTLSPLDRLSYVGKRGMGALLYEPEIQEGNYQAHHDLDQIAEECLHVQTYDDDLYIDDLLHMNGSSAGARPKILVRLMDNDWIIKFASSLDPKDIGSVEYAYHLMAVKAGLDVPDAKLFESKKTSGYFGVKRFDRIDGKFLHMHTLSGLLHTDHKLFNMDYESLLKATLWLTKDLRECEKQFRHAVFNVLSHNRDDHAKNFSFVMHEDGVWNVSPAYDLTFSTGPMGEHCMTMMGEGKKPQLSQLLKLASIAGIKKEKALEIVDEVNTATLLWGDFADTAHVIQKSKRLIQTTLEAQRKDFFYKGIP